MDTEAQQDSTANTKPGQKAPSFTCKTLSGKEYNIDQLKGKVVMINFFATWCPGCNQELPELEKDIWKKYRNNPDFVLLVIGREHSREDLVSFAAGKNLDLPFVPDPGREIYRLYASKFIPRNIVIDKNGMIVFQNSGFTPKELVEIEKLISENLK
ncbi:MAG TPA: TlpA disulfide reductase family protein [Bacteroidales bacterium]|nr:TlpA disulfide reductase family protein [Bacteroidales bacterium]